MVALLALLAVFGSLLLVAYRVIPA